jgi:hypothetical protein
VRVTRSGQVERSVGIFKVDQNVVVDRPVEAIFAFLSNIENWAQVQPALRESEGGSPRAPMEVGSTFRQTLDIPGRQVELLGTVTGYELDERLSFDYSWDNLSLDLSFIFEPLDSGTLLTARGVGSLGGLLVLFEQLVSGEINAQLKRSLEDVKYRLESEPDVE